MIQVNAENATRSISSFKSAGKAIKLESKAREINFTNLETFIEYEQMYNNLQSAIEKYAAIVNQDALAMQNVVDSLEEKDQEIAHQICEKGD